MGPTPGDDGGEDGGDGEDGEDGGGSCVVCVRRAGARVQAASPEEAKAPEFAQEFGARVRFSRG